MTFAHEPIAITGYGLTCASGAGLERWIAALAEERSLLAPLPAAVADGLPSVLGAAIPDAVFGDRAVDGERARIASQLALSEAVAAAGWDATETRRVGLALGTRYVPLARLYICSRR